MLTWKPLNKRSAVILCILSCFFLFILLICLFVSFPQPVFSALLYHILLTRWCPSSITMSEARLFKLRVSWEWEVKNVISMRKFWLRTNLPIWKNGGNSVDGVNKKCYEVETFPDFPGKQKTSQLPSLCIVFVENLFFSSDKINLKMVFEPFIYLFFLLFPCVLHSEPKTYMYQWTLLRFWSQYFYSEKPAQNIQRSRHLHMVDMGYRILWFKNWEVQTFLLLWNLVSCYHHKLFC